MRLEWFGYVHMYKTRDSLGIYKAGPRMNWVDWAQGWAQNEMGRLLGRRLDSE